MGGGGIVCVDKSQQAQDVLLKSKHNQKEETFVIYFMV